ncbi:ArdC family protein [Glycomyces buryatensis]|uniref:N-terminal domain-containing protein n=1 Tax=Glycomyces buryatensis TaxID=2570927 RepID=A0A4S8PVU4_9ACTN|nr:ArdC family protein [Glycomyces buryatensis]THV35717.1 hypothetical protein FAB82_22860 [Glycomyces buryatensis]
MGRKTYTEEEKAAFKERDRELAEAADAALAAPGAGARATEVALRSPKLAAYSLRNHMMLALQAEQAGIELRDVDTGRGWKERGRTPRKGSKAVMRIVYPITPKSGEADTSEDGETPKTRFRTKAVFEIDQTDESETFTSDPKVAPESDPARIWHDRLLREAASLGYTVRYTRPDEAAALAVTDGESKTIAVAAADPLALAPEALGALADRLAEALTAARADGSAKPNATAARQAGPDAGTVLEFD